MNGVNGEQNHNSLKAAVLRQKFKRNIFRTKSVVFHCDLSTIVEMKHRYDNQCGLSSPKSVIGTGNPPESTPGYQYPMRKFVAVKASSSAGFSMAIF